MPRLLLFISLFALSGLSFAHGDLGPRILDLDIGIEIDPGNPDLFLRRGNLNLLAVNREAALEDFERALEINPEISDAELGRAKALLGLGKDHHALRTIERFQERYPDRSAGWILHARILRKLDRNEEAAQSLSEAINRIPRPEPDLYLERARSFLNAGPDFIDEALEGLDEGLCRLGPLVSLQSPAIELELERENYEAALDRLGVIERAANRKEKWVFWRGEILIRAGRRLEAKRAFEEALARIESLPPRLRNTRATLELRRETLRHLDSLDGHGNEAGRDD